jgi:hypothetical protein
VFPVRYELDSYIIFRKNSEFHGLKRRATTEVEFLGAIRILMYSLPFFIN